MSQDQPVINTAARTTTPAPEPGLLGELDRMAPRMRVSASGLVFFVLLTIVMSIRRTIQGGISPVITGETFIRLIWLMVLGVLIAPLLHGLVRRAAASRPASKTRAGYSRMLLLPIWVSLACLPLSMVGPVWPEAVIFGCSFFASSLGDLLAYIWLRRFPPQARVVETKKLIQVFKA